MNKRAHAGFTLIEVVIALAITAVIMTISYQSFDSASRGVESGREVLDDINQLDRAWQLIGQDLRHLLPPVTSSNPDFPDTLRQIFRGESPGEDLAGEQLLLQLSRRDWLNPTGRPRSDLQQVIYRLDDNTLWRDYRPERNLEQQDWLYGEDLLHQQLLAGIESIELRFLSKELARRQGDGLLKGNDYLRDWDDIWPANNSGNALTLPRAINIRIRLTSGLEGERLYAIDDVE